MLVHRFLGTLSGGGTSEFNRPLPPGARGAEFDETVVQGVLTTAPIMLHVELVRKVAFRDGLDQLDPVLAVQEDQLRLGPWLSRLTA